MITSITISANGYEQNHNCSKHPIYCQILNNKPSVKRAYAFKLSNIIHKTTKKYNLDPVIFSAILAQESMYKITAKNCTTGLVKVNIVDDEDGITLLGEVRYTKNTVCTDFGIGQIYYKTANSYGFDINRLTNDLDYSIEAAAIVLEFFKTTYSSKEETWWTRYNASNKVARGKYKKLVNRFLYAN